MMIRQLDTSDLAPFEEDGEQIIVHGNFAIIRDIAKIKEKMMSTSIGHLLYIHMGRVMLVTTGWARLRINMQPCRIEQGYVLLIPENFYLEVIEVSSDYNAQIIGFREIPISFKRWTIIPMEQDGIVRMQSYIDLLCQVAHSQSSTPAVTDHLLCALLEDLYLQNSKFEIQHSNDSTPSAVDQLMQRFFDLLAESDGTVRSVTAFADRLCVSPNHLSTVVKKQSGQTVMQLLNAHTILHAKALLRYSKRPVYDIADLLGFENSPSFCRFFKRETGVSPLQYRGVMFTV